MRVAVVYFAPRSRSRAIPMAKALATGIEAQGHQVDLIDGLSDQNKKLIIYQYVAIGTEQTSLLGKIHEKIGYFLASQGSVQGKKGFAFVVKKQIGAPRALLRLMAAMEKEGMLVKNSEIFFSQAQAMETGKYLHIEK
jgi:menaquinone-dependent protoporphyrinogen IX oxidase